MADRRQEDKYHFKAVFDKHEAWRSYEMPNNVQAEGDSVCVSVH